MQIEICDLVPTEAEMAMPYMDGMQHNKTIQPEFCRGSCRKESRKGKYVDPSHMSEESVPLVTDIGVREAHITDDDDDFVDPPQQCEGLSHQETPCADEGPSDPQHSLNEEQHHGIQGSALRLFLSLFKCFQIVVTVHLALVTIQFSWSRASFLRSHVTIYLNHVYRCRASTLIRQKRCLKSSLMQGQLKHYMIEIRTNIQFLSESVTAMISSSMDEILRRFNDRKGCPVNEYEDTEAAVEGFEKIDEVGGKLQPVVDMKGKGKVDPTEDVAFPSSLEPPSFDLGIGYTQPDDLESAEIQKQSRGLPTTEPTSELPVKRASRPARILRSPFVVGEGKVLQHDGNVTVFGNYKDHVEEADKSAFLGWFQRGKKFNEHDNQIKPTFSIGLYPVGHKTWFHQLIDAETSLSGSNKIKDIFPFFQKNPQVLLSEINLIKAVTGRLISLSTSWADIDYVFMSLLPTNKAHRMLGIEPYVKVLSALMKALGISKKNPDYNESECKQMKVTIDSTLPQQTNGHDCGVFVILYALYILRDGRCAIPYKFDAVKCRIDIASLLYKHREPYVKKAGQAFKGEKIVIE
ncbi:sentrin-specific protease 1-like [Olea europaea subsp. europaea]|uniref:Sentrin-specific protease 1-like n=1 Tax=Olea europaea subsp. europaea TaxID=158383 RepID=A0A8S0Q832_OLEEU|nr:sentrin-specific protease 1-like [Olea europaea subsp. europaea]